MVAVVDSPASIAAASAELVLARISRVAFLGPGRDREFAARGDSVPIDLDDAFAEVVDDVKSAVERVESNSRRRRKKRILERNGDRPEEFLQVSAKVENGELREARDPIALVRSIKRDVQWTRRDRRQMGDQVAGG